MSPCHGHGELGNLDKKKPPNSHIVASAQRLLIEHIGERRNPHASQPQKGSAMCAALAANATKDTAQLQPAPKSIPVALPEKETKTQERVGLAQGQQGLPGMYCLVLLAFFRNTWALPNCFICTTPYCACCKTTMHHLSVFEGRIEGSCRTAMDDQASEQSDK